MENLLWNWVCFWIQVGWHLGPWWLSIGGWTGFVARLGLSAMVLVVTLACVYGIREIRQVQQQQPEAPEPITQPLKLAHLQVPTTHLRDRVGRYPVEGVLAAAEAELALLWEEQEERGEA